MYSHNITIHFNYLLCFSLVYKAAIYPKNACISIHTTCQMLEVLLAASLSRSVDESSYML